jgi:hypothetical protein
VVARPGGDRRWAGLQAATGGTVRLADDEQLVTQWRELREERYGKRAGAEERDPAELRH